MVDAARPRAGRGSMRKTSLRSALQSIFKDLGDFGFVHSALHGPSDVGPDRKVPGCLRLDFREMSTLENAASPGDDD